MSTLRTPPAGPQDDPWRLPALRGQLLAWYAAAGRDLPWRRTQEPYEILVSELMLQQTQVARVVQAWPRFLAHFPDVASLAAAPTAQVVDAWQGLGYNRRAISLQRAAQTIVERHGGVVPSRVTELEALPGIGPYTARAVAAFAFGQPAAPVDTNVMRVLARAVTAAPQRPGQMQRLADELVPSAAPADWSQALMDLGARVCTLRAPRCGSCPVAGRCGWRLAGFPAPDPAAGTGSRTRAQSPFEGSDRWHRGRLVDALREGPIARDRLGEAAGLADDPSRLKHVVEGLIADGLAERRGSMVALPGAENV